MYEDDLKDAAGRFSRRSFLKRVGGGVVVLFATQARFAFAEDGAASGAAPAFNAYLRIGGDGRVTCFTGKIEMGQGVITSLPQMLADELDVAVDMIDMVMGDTDRCPFDQGTWGSLTTRVFGPELRAAGAQARAVLLELASERAPRRARRSTGRQQWRGLGHRRPRPQGELCRTDPRQGDSPRHAVAGPGQEACRVPGHGHVAEAT